MPLIESVDELVEHLADLAGVYGSHDERCTPQRQCRVCWTSGLGGRMRRAVENEKQLEWMMAKPANDHPEEGR